MPDATVILALLGTAAVVLIPLCLPADRSRGVAPLLRPDRRG